VWPTVSAVFSTSQSAATTSVAATVSPIMSGTPRRKSANLLATRFEVQQEKLSVNVSANANLELYGFITNSFVAPFKKKSFQYHAQERRHKSFELTSSATKYVDSKI